MVTFRADQLENEMDFVPGDVVEVFDVVKSEYEPHRDDTAVEHLKATAANIVANWGGIPLHVLGISEPFVLTSPVNRPSCTMVLDMRLVTLRVSNFQWMSLFNPSQSSRRRREA